ncbi:hypothetical protein CYMTET_14745 [Cymbomonas tetramitiformis]|uniref:Phytanoyl-CoA dioxygenase n=1 Tax=Cymbomonas tetramitiformis TaxID=36881 RepID=A0AAE0GFR9_9CHLO|nr:hypothetical protein CYMTET_14745 [Cymbomonas tetramitiformis]
MAQKYMKKKTPGLIASALLNSISRDGTPLNAEVRLKLKLSITKLAEELTEEATRREHQMHDECELNVIDACIDSIKKGEVDRALRSLEERKGHLERRGSQRQAEHKEDADSDGWDSEEENPDPTSTPEEDAGSGPKKGSEGSEQIVEALNLDDPKHWLDLIDAQLHILDEAAIAAPVVEDLDTEALRAHLLEHGYLQSTAVYPRPRLEALMSGIRALEGKGWPAVFIFMYDEAWHLIDGIWDHVEAIMGGPCVLEPSFTAFRLSHKKSADGEKYIGNNFGLPHRDYSYAEALATDGSTQLLSVWFPLNDITVDNGCMYVVPKEFDGNFERDHAYEHKQVVTQGGVKGTEFLHFGLAGVRPLPAAAGSILAWQSNVIHWGSSCSSRGAHDPRTSLAFVFRRDFSNPDPECPPLRRDQLNTLTVSERIRFVTRTIAYFKHWYTIPEAMKRALSPYAAFATTTGSVSENRYSSEAYEASPAAEPATENAYK